MFSLCLELELATSMKEARRPSMQPDDEDVVLVASASSAPEVLDIR